MEKKTKIYLACPYTHVDPDVMEARFVEVTRQAAILIARGYIVFSPITHSHLIAKYGQLDGDWSVWAKQDTAFIDWCNEVCVLMLDGWRDSVGIKAEIKYADQLGKPIVYMPKKDDNSYFDIERTDNGK